MKRHVGVVLCVTLALVLGAPPGAMAQFGESSFPNHDEVVARVQAAAAAAPEWIDLQAIGTSTSGRELYLTVVTDPASDVPMNERVVTLILTQQHGNEPAGTPAALDLLDDLATDGHELRRTLANQVLLLAPMGNPDGAEARQRGNGVGTDLNRDHVHLEEPETQAVHGIFQSWDVHVGVDHHEYSGAGTGYPNPVRAYDHDLTTLFPRHGNVRQPTMDAAQRLMYEGMWPAAEEAGYSINEYGEQTAAGVPIQHAAGGPDPGILRNNFGLNNVAGILVESFVPSAVPNPFVSEERRVDAHRVLMDATLAYVSNHAQVFVDAKRESSRLNVEEPLQEYLEAWPDNPVTGEPGEIRRGPLAPAYRSPTDLTDTLAKHGLPTGIADDGQWIYTIDHERAGLLAAMVHPESSRQLASSAVPLDSAPRGDADEEAVASEGEDSPSLPLVVMLGALLAVLAASRRRIRLT